MAHFAKIEDGVVTDIHVVNNAVITDADGNEQESMGKEFLVGLHGEATWIQTSYNNTFRKNYAGGGGYTYDETRDAFIPPKPYPSWLLDEDTCRWKPPTPEPEDSVRFTPIEERKFDDPGKKYYWDEDTTSWIEREL